jgi:hypothetical protein
MYFIHGFQWREKLRRTVAAVAALTDPQRDAVDAGAETPGPIEPSIQPTAATVGYNENKAGQLTLF